MKDVPVLAAGPLAPSNFNAPAQEVRNFVLSSGQVLSEADVYQLAKAVADYSAVGNFYTGGGAANVYTAAAVGTRQGVHALQDGALIRFRVPATNTGASTLAVNGLTAKNIKCWDGSALQACDLIINETVTVEYNSGADEFRLIARSSMPDLIPPVGTTFAFNDFNGAAKFNVTIHHYNNDDILADANSRLNGKTIVDMSNRYMVGLGAEGGKDIGTVPWSNTPVGNASHQVDVSHTHGPGTLQFKTFEVDAGQTFYGYESDGTPFAVLYDFGLGGGATNSATWYAPGSIKTFYTKDGTGASASGGSVTQSIQVRSVPFRVLTRVR